MSCLFMYPCLLKKKTFCNAIVISVASRSSRILCIVMAGASSSSRWGPDTRRMSRAELERIVAADDAALALQLLMWEGSFKLVLEFELKTNQVTMSNV